jgi:hypothetical protein
LRTSNPASIKEDEEGPVTIEEWQRLTNRKAPGPNGLNLELFKYRTILLEQTLFYHFQT